MSALQRAPNSRLEALLRFLRASASRLAIDSRQLLQLALNAPDGSQIVAMSRAAWEAGPRHPTSWLRWLDKPVDRDPRVLTVVGREREVTACVVSPEGDRLVTSAEFGPIRVWDMTTGEPIAVWERGGFELRFSNDGAVVAAAGSAIELIDARTGQLRAKLQAPGAVAGDPDSPCLCGTAAFSADGRLLVSARTANEDCDVGEAEIDVLLWDLTTGEVVATFPGTRSGVGSCRITPTGSRVVAAGHDDRVRVWDVDSGELVHTLPGGPCCDLSPDGALIATPSQDSDAPGLVLWSAESGEQLRLLPWEEMTSPFSVGQCCFSRDGKRVAATSTEPPGVRVWSADSGDVLARLTGFLGAVWGCDFDPSGERLATASFDYRARVWDLESASAPREKGENDALPRRSFDSPAPSELESIDGSLDARFVADSPKRPEMSENVTVWSRVVNRALARLPPTDWYVGAFAWSTDACWLLSYHTSVGPVLWSPWSRDWRWVFDKHFGELTCAAFAPDGLTVVAAYGDGAVFVIDARTGASIFKLEGHRRRVTSLAVLPDGRHLATCSHDGTVRLWDLESGVELAVFSRETMQRRILLSEGGELTVYDGVGAVRLRVESRLPTVAVVTAVRRWRELPCAGIGDRRYGWDRQVKIECPCCRLDFEVPPLVGLAIAEHCELLGPEDSPCMALPREAWDDERLRSQCPGCGVPWKVNPFQVDNARRPQPTGSEPVGLVRPPPGLE